MHGITSLKEYDHHTLISFFSDPKTGMRGYIAIHRGNKAHPSFGATRVAIYASEEEALQDALRLSRMMSYKSALAGLTYGGAKGVIIQNSFRENDRDEALRSYGDRVNYFGGRFITGSDVGIREHDLAILKKKSPYVVGCTVDPSYYTAYGVFTGIRVCLKEVFGNDGISGRVFAVQGLGKIGWRVMEFMYTRGGRVRVADINQKTIQRAQKLFPGVIVVKPHRIHREKVDVYVPCALQHALNKKQIPELRARIVAGGANNQLENREAGVMLHARGILYAPDYVVNAGGLVSVADEYGHKNQNKKRILRKIIRIRTTLETIFKKSKQTGMPPGEIADRMAQRIIEKYV